MGARRRQSSFGHRVAAAPAFAGLDRTKFQNRVGVTSMMSRHALDALGQQISGGGLADVTQADHADHPLAPVDLPEVRSRWSAQRRAQGGVAETWAPRAKFIALITRRS